jgi:N-ethylmaleimide reductase
LEQFLSPICNSRVDKYGGNIENRSRFVIEVVTNVAETIGRENTAICLSPYGEGIAHYPEINDTYAYLSANFNRLGIAYIRLDDNFIKRPHKIPIKLRKLMRNNFKNSIILSGWL